MFRAQSQSVAQARTSCPTPITLPWPWGVVDLLWPPLLQGVPSMDSQMALGVFQMLILSCRKGRRGLTAHLSILKILELVLWSLGKGGNKGRVGEVGSGK